MRNGIAVEAHTQRYRQHTSLKRAVAALACFVVLLASQTLKASALEPGDAEPSTAQSVSADAELEQLVQDEGAALGSRLTGAWLDPDGTAVVGITDGAVPPRLANHPKVRVVTQRFSTAVLDAVIETVASRLNALFAPSYPYVARVNVRDNLVDIEIDRDQESKRSAIESALANELRSGTVRIFYGRTVAQQDTASTFPQIVGEIPGGDAITGGITCTRTGGCPTPFRGGQEVNGTGADPDSCTLGFVMRNSAGVRFMSTVSHCAGSPWRHGGRDIGSTIWTQDSGRVDFKVIRETNEREVAPTNWVYRNFDPSASITLKITSPGSSLVGNYLCSEGKVTGSSCGALTSYNTTVQGRTGFGEMANASCHGDSGAPVIADSTLRAYGLSRAIAVEHEDDLCGSPSYFGWVPYFESASGYLVLLTATTEGLGPGQRLNAGWSIKSRDGRYRVVMQSDGNLVLYQSSGAVWATGTNGNSGSWAVMQNDGNLVVRRPGGTAIWASNTAGNSGSRLIIQNDRNLVIYRSNGTASWASGTNI